ncbi:importin beta-like SAD2 homolog [Cyclospora cayetanensis]|uniref:Importin beta-like SAD2 homolog n=1 Tax=Cyclospora cayetanensis TaxID=88456 RepID=A0A6P6RV42_9EIME|nr:importin beta-like SAD2 homolog [Cyclospora cayetanensis]
MAVQPEELCKVLEGTYSPNAEVRGQAEAFLKSISPTEGLLSALVQILRHDQVDLPVRTAASVTLKNEVRQHWESRSADGDEGVSSSGASASQAGSTGVYGEEEKQILRQSLYPMVKELGGQAAPVRLQLIECIRIIALQDYPERWPTILDEVCADLGPSNDACLPASLLANLSTEERSQLPVYKAKKWALQIVQRVFTRFGDPKMLKRERSGPVKEGHEVAKAFGTHFIDTWSRRLTEELLVILQHHAQQQQLEAWMSPRMLNLALQYLSRAVECAALYTPVIKPHGVFLVFQVCLPLMHYSQDDAETWETEPVEFIRRQSDPLEAFSQPREAAIEFIKSLVRYRSKDFLEPMYMAVHRVCAEYQQAVQSRSLTEDMFRAKDGALMLAGAVCDRLTSKKRQAPIEGMLSSFVLPDLGSPNKFLRMRACWVYEVFLERVNTWHEPAAVVEAYNRMLALLGDPELPVRVQAGVSIKAFFDLDLPELQQVIVPNLKWLAERLFVLMQDIDHDQLVTTLEQLVASNEQHIAPLAKDLTAALATALLAMLNREGAAQRNKDEDAEDDAAFASIAVMSTLKTVLGAVTETPHVYSEILPDLLPALGVLVSPDAVDHFEDTLEILSYFTFYLPAPFPPSVWAFFGALYQAVCGGSTASRPLPEGMESGWATDHLEQMMPVLVNFISRDPDTFATGMTEKAQQEAEAVDKATKRAFILFISSLLVYALEPSIQLMQQKQILEPILSFVFENAGIVEAYEQRKTFVLGFAPLLRSVASAPAQWPQWLMQNVEALVPILASHGIALRGLRDKAEDGAADSDIGSDNDSEQSLDDTQDAQLHAATESILQKLEAEWDDEDDEDWDADLDGDDAGLRFEPLESIDELKVLREALALLPPEAAQKVQTALGPEGLEKLVSSKKGDAFIGAAAEVLVRECCLSRGVTFLQALLSSCPVFPCASFLHQNAALTDPPPLQPSQ